MFCNGLRLSTSNKENDDDGDDVNFKMTVCPSCSVEEVSDIKKVVSLVTLHYNVPCFDT